MSTNETVSIQTVEVREPAKPAIMDRPADLLSVIAQAVADPRIDVEKMERLLAMHEKVTKDRREVAYKDAMARLQAKVPHIDKHGKAKNSRYAKLEDIDVVIRPMLAEEGFSVSLDEESHTEKTTTFACTFSHKEGHSDTKRLTVAIDVSARNREGHSIRPAIQDDGSTVSYARRYLIKMHLNLIEKGEDTDGQNLATITKTQAQDLQAKIEEVGADIERFLAFMEVSKLDEILGRDYKKALSALEAKRRK